MQDVSQSLNNRQKTSETFNLIGGILLCYFTGQLIAQQLIQWLFGLNVQQIANLLMHPKQALLYRNHIIFLQICSALFSLLLLPAAYFYFISKQKIDIHLFNTKQLMPLAVVLTVVWVIAFIPVNETFIKWNGQLQLPGWLSELERHLQQREQQAFVLTSLYTSSIHIVGQLLFIALIPAVGEEFFFRGIVQTRLTSLLENKHVVILITGFLFSCLHLQFYGFLPRMLQGILFGYLFWWSKNLWYPIIAHFTNNAFFVLMHYFWQPNQTSINSLEKSSAPFYVSLAALLATCILFIALKRCFSRYHVAS